MNKWIKLSLVLIFFAAVSVALYLILKAFNIADIEALQNLILKTGNCGFIVFIIIATFILVCFCFVPVLNTTLIISAIVLFGPKTAFFACMIAKALSASILFFLGDKFGEKLATKLIGKDELEHAQNIIDTKSKILLPLSFVIPGFPDDAVCIVAGMTKMKYWYFIIINVICHTIEIGVMCFLGSNVIDWSSLKITDWIIVINLIIVDIYLLFKLEKFIENKTKSNKKVDKN